MTNRISSGSISSTMPLFSTMNGLSAPSAIALTIGLWLMYSSGTRGRSRM